MSASKGFYSKPWCLVSPGSRGIGLALVRHLLRTTRAPVVATMRATTSRLVLREEKFREECLRNFDGEDFEDAGARLHVIPTDVRSETSVEHASRKMNHLFPSDTHHLRLAFCIPGILHVEKNISQITTTEAAEQFRINVIGPLLQMKHFSSFLPRQSTRMTNSDDDHQLQGLPSEHSVFAVMSARVGSTTDNRSGGWYSYRASKAGVTSIARTFDKELQMTRGNKAMCVALHPGTVKTDFSKEYRSQYEKRGATISPAESAEALVNVVNKLTKRERGLFFDWLGNEVPP